MVRNLAMTTDLDAIGNTVVAHENDRAIRLKPTLPRSSGESNRCVAMPGWAPNWKNSPSRRTPSPFPNPIRLTRPPMPNRRSKAKASRATPASSSTSANLPASTPSPSPLKVEAAIEELRTALPEGVQLLTIYRQRDFIDLAIGNLGEALRDGAIMVAIVLFLFLFNFRVTLITLTAIPLSLRSPSWSSTCSASASTR